MILGEFTLGASVSPTVKYKSRARGFDVQSLPPWNQMSHSVLSSHLSLVIQTFLGIQNPSFISDCFSQASTAKLGLKWLVLQTTYKVIMLNEPKTMFPFLCSKNGFNLLSFYLWRPWTELLALGGYQCVPSNTHVPAFHSPDWLKPHLRPWLIEEGMTYLSQGEKKHLPRMREQDRENQGNQSISNGLCFSYDFCSISKFSPQLGLLQTPQNSCYRDPGSKHILNQFKSKQTRGKLRLMELPRKERHFWASVKH